MQLYSVCYSALTLQLYFSCRITRVIATHSDYGVGPSQDLFSRILAGDWKMFTRSYQREREIDQIGLFESPSQYIAQHINELVDRGCSVFHFLDSTMTIVVPAHTPRWKRQRVGWTAAANWNFIVTVKLFNWFSKFPIGGVSLLLGQLFRPSVHATMALICVSVRVVL